MTKFKKVKLAFFRKYCNSEPYIGCEIKGSAGCYILFDNKNYIVMHFFKSLNEIIEEYNLKID